MPFISKYFLAFLLAALATATGLAPGAQAPSTSTATPDAPPRSALLAPAPPQSLPQDAELLLHLAESFGPRMAGALWLPDGPAASAAIAATPAGQLASDAYAAPALQALARMASGLPLPPAAWTHVLQGPALLVWVRPDAPLAPSAATGPSEDSAQSTRPAQPLPAPEPFLAIRLDPTRRKEVIQWLATDGFGLAAKRHPGLVARRQRTAGATLHVWVRERSGFLPRRSGPVMAYAEREGVLIIAAGQRLISQTLARELRPAFPPDANTTPPLPVPLRSLMQNTTREKALLAASLDIPAFPALVMGDTLSRALSLDPLRRMANQLAQSDEATSAALTQTRQRIGALSAHLPHGGLADARRLDILYWADSLSTPRSRTTLVFSPEARTWMRRLPEAGPLHLPEHAPEQTVAFWAMRVPVGWVQDDASSNTQTASPPAPRQGAEVGRMVIPTARRVSTVHWIEAPLLVHWIRAETTHMHDAFTSKAAQLPVRIPIDGPWRRVQDTLNRVRSIVPFAGEVHFKMRIIGNAIVLSRSSEALEAIAAVERGEAPSLRQSRPQIFLSSMSVRDLDPTLQHTRPSYERFSDWAARVDVSQNYNLFIFDPKEWLSQEEAIPYDLNWLGLLSRIPKARERLIRWPPHHTQMIWQPGEPPALCLETTSASGLPGDITVWAALAVSLLPSFDQNPLAGPMEKLKSFEWPAMKPSDAPRQDTRDDTPGEAP